MPQAEHRLQAWAPAGRQALGTRVHATVNQDAVGRGPSESLSPLPAHCPTHPPGLPPAQLRPLLCDQATALPLESSDFPQWPFEDDALPGPCTHGRFKGYQR